MKFFKHLALIGLTAYGQSLFAMQAPNITDLASLKDKAKEERINQIAAYYTSLPQGRTKDDYLGDIGDYIDTLSGRVKDDFLSDWGDALAAAQIQLAAEKAKNEKIKKLEEELINNKLEIWKEVRKSLRYIVTTFTNDPIPDYEKSQGDLLKNLADLGVRMTNTDVYERTCPRDPKIVKEAQSIIKSIFAGVKDRNKITLEEWKAVAQKADEQLASYNREIDTLDKSTIEFPFLAEIIQCKKRIIHHEVLEILKIRPDIEQNIVEKSMPGKGVSSASYAVEQLNKKLLKNKPE